VGVSACEVPVFACEVCLFLELFHRFQPRNEPPAGLNLAGIDKQAVREPLPEPPRLHPDIFKRYQFAKVRPQPRFAPLDRLP